MSKERYNRKGLKKRLACILMIYMDGLNEYKKEKFRKYVESKLERIVDYYMGQLKKKEREQLMIPLTVEEPLIISAEQKKNRKQNRKKQLQEKK